MIVYESSWITVRWDEALKAAWVEIRTYAEGEEYRAGLNAILGLCQRKRNSRYLGDARSMAAVSQADQRWVNEEWIPQIVTAGVRHMALVIPKTAVARLSMRQILSKVNDVNLVTSHFETLELARAWLRTV